MWVIREVQTGELTMQFKGGSIVSTSGSFGSVEVTQVMGVSHIHNSALPLAGTLMNGDTFVARHTVNATAFIELVLLLSHEA